MIRVTSDAFHLELLSLSKADDKYHFLYVHSCSIVEGCYMPLALSIQGEIHVVGTGIFQGCKRC